MEAVLTPLHFCKIIEANISDQSSIPVSKKCAFISKAPHYICTFSSCQNWKKSLSSVLMYILDMLYCRFYVKVVLSSKIELLGFAASCPNGTMLSYPYYSNNGYCIPHRCRFPCSMSHISRACERKQKKADMHRYICTEPLVQHRKLDNRQMKLIDSADVPHSPMDGGPTVSSATHALPKQT